MALTLKLRVLDCNDISESGNGIIWNLEAHDAEIDPDDQNGEGSGELRPKEILCCLNTDSTQLSRDCRSKGLRGVALLVDLAAATGSGCPSRAWLSVYYESWSRNKKKGSGR
jgi:hypothetical protein